MTVPYPKRLIEVDLPIKRISAHARREKSIRQGHLSTLHIWWARRPLAACRAVILGSLWPDPGDPNCPERFRNAAREWMLRWAQQSAAKGSAHSFERLVRIQKDARVLDDPIELRRCLLDFIADFANWDNSNDSTYLETSRALVQVAHEALGGAPGTRPLVVDPFAGGGAIPLEALRVGADAFASDLNPVAVLLNRVVLEYLPTYGPQLAEKVRTWGDWVKREAEERLAEFYPKDPDGATPIAYLWARTVSCEGPGCGAEVPLVRSLWLSRKPDRLTALQILPQPALKRVAFRLITRDRGEWVDTSDRTSRIQKPVFDGTVKRGSATCPCCAYTTPVERIRIQLRARSGGAADAQLLCVVTTIEGQARRSYRLPADGDFEALRRADTALRELEATASCGLPLLPEESLPVKGTLGFRVQNYGILRWRDLFTPRQGLTLATLESAVMRIADTARSDVPFEEACVIQAVLAISLNRLVGRVNSLCWWRSQADQEKVEVAFSGQTVPMKWDFAEGCPLTNGTAGWEDSYAAPAQLIQQLAGSLDRAGNAAACNAARQSLPDDVAHAFVTDPPYYDAVPYGALSDFFYVWLKRTVPGSLRDLFSAHLAPKDEECIVDAATGKDRAWFERGMTAAMAEGRRILLPSGIGAVVFAHKSTRGWEAQLQAMVDAGWTVTGSWPIDTEQEQRIRARDSAALASSIHLICRPREHPDGSVRTDAIGDWRDVLAELPKRIHEWMPRLAEEGVVGADAIFACLGPALEVFSRYSRVEKASGEQVMLKEYLEHVWAAVAKEALSMIFAGAETSGFEEDARLTAMWLWTLSTGGGNGRPETRAAEEEDTVNDGDDDDADRKATKVTGFTLEYDAARKIAQGLGAHLEALRTLVEVDGETARLLPVAERTRALFGKAEAEAPTALRKKKALQMTLGFAEQLEQAEEVGGWGQKGAPQAGQTVLDRVHQTMILFAAGRGEGLRRFLVDDGVGRDARFWRLAQALAALYPTGTDERRWVEGVLARKKGLGF